MKIKKVAKKLEKMGGKEDTILAHINPEEAAVLKDGGGSGKRNPKTGLLSFGGYEGGGADFGDANGEGGFQGGDWGGGNDVGFGGAYGGDYGTLAGPSVGKPGESAQAQAAASQPAMTPDAYAGLQQSMLDAIGKQDSGLINSILGGLLGPLGTLGGKMGLGDSLSQAWNERDIMGTPYGGSSGGGFFGGDGGNIAENEHGGDSPGGGMLQPSIPAAPAPSMGGFAPIAAQPFVSKWGKPRTRGYFGS